MPGNKDCGEGCCEFMESFVYGKALIGDDLFMKIKDCSSTGQLRFYIPLRHSDVFRAFFIVPCRLSVCGRNNKVGISSLR